MHTNSNVEKTKILQRELNRSETFLIRGARIFVGDGTVIENGAVLVRGGKIAEVYQGNGPDPKTVNAEVVEAAGKTILPGLIDVHVHLGAPAGFYPDMASYNPDKMMLRNLAAYLYSGVTTVRSVGDGLDGILKARSEVNSGEMLGAELFTCGPLFTAKGGHGTEYFKQLPPAIRERAEQQFTRIPTSPEEARKQVDNLKSRGVDCIKAILESGAGGHVFNHLDPGIFAAIAQEAHADDLPLAVHTGDVSDVTEAVQAQANSIEHGSFPRGDSRCAVRTDGPAGDILRSHFERGRSLQGFRGREDRFAQAFFGAASRATGIVKGNRGGDGVQRHRRDSCFDCAISH